MNSAEQKVSIANESLIGLIKGAIGAIPYFGTAVNEALFEINSRIKQKRINILVEKLKVQIEKIDEKVIDKEYLRSDDFYDLTKILMENILRTGNEEKINFLAKVYLNGVINRVSYEDDLGKIFSGFIMELSPMQIIILKFIAENEGGLDEVNSYENLLNIFQQHHSGLQIDRYQFKYFCQDLENKGLVTFGSGLADFYSTKGYILLESSKPSPALITSFGKTFIHILNQ